MKNQFFGISSLLALSIPAALFTLAPNAQAANFVIGSTASTTLGSLAGAIRNTTDKSGLSTTYTSGVTDFDTYSATASNSSTSSFWFTNLSGLGKYVTFNLGASYDLNALALWNSSGTSGVGNFSLYTDTDTSTTTVGTLIGSFNAVNSGLNSPLQRFNFASTVTTQFIQMKLNTNGGGGSVGFNEVAFRGSAPAAVPEPLTILGAATAAAFGAAFKRRKSQD